MKEISRKLLEFVDGSPSCFHAVENIRKELVSAGFQELFEGTEWDITFGGKYFVTRNGSSIIAFRIPEKEFGGFQIVASHSDSPCFKIKENAEITVDNKYTKLNVEKYGGMLCAPWLDRPLSIAGRLMVREGNAIRTKLVNVDRDLVLIPNLAIHMNREINDGYKFNPQVDMLPLFGDENAKDQLMSIIADEAGIEETAIIGSDLFLYNRMTGTFWGAAEEYISGARLDDLQCAFASLQGFKNSSNSENVTVYAVFDNEEVGSGTKQGALSTFLKDTLVRINYGLGRTNEQYLTAIANSFMVSADNAHAVHPNHADKSDPVNRPYMNGGVVIKYNANQKYTTDAISAALFKTICENAQVPYQTFTNRSDMAGGSTLGNLSNTQVSMNTVDIGAAQLAMHSPYETAGAFDTEYLYKAIEQFYNTAIIHVGNGVFRLQ